MSTLTKANLDSIRFASKDATRSALMALNVRDKFTEATDGHRLMRVPLESNGDTGVLKAAAVQTANKATKAGGHVRFEGTTLETDSCLSIPAVVDTDSTYPDCDKIWPEVTREWTRIGINAGYLAEIAAFFKRHSDADPAVLELYFDPSGPEVKPIVMVSGEFQALLMPCRIDENHLANR